MHVDNLTAALAAADTLRELLCVERAECIELRVAVFALTVDRANLEQRVRELRAALDRTEQQWKAATAEAAKEGA